MNRPRIVITGTQSGAGKTSVSLALMSALARAGHRVQAFKAGPDYIDPSYHRVATGFPSHNLDTWLLSPETVQWLFQTKSEGADVAVIEGVMGLYDGLSGKDETSSTAQLAKLLRAPVVLVVDAQGMARSAAALVAGYRRFDPEVRFGGVILNRVGSLRHYGLLKESIEHYTDVPVLGALFKDAKARIPERHLGLTVASENQDLKDCLETLAGLAQGGPDRSGLDLQKVMDLARSAPTLEPAVRPWPRPADDAAGARIGIAQDRAFSFYYQANLDLLQECGAELVPFSPLSDRRVPEGCGALYFGGGFPEIYARELEDNEPLRLQIGQLIREGLPVYAECGGLMYLSERIETLEGGSHAMVGAVPGKIAMTRRLQSFGYKQGRMLEDNVLGPKGGTLRGHEFHYSQREGAADAGAAYELVDRKAEKRQREGYARGGLLASYLHLHFLSDPEWARSFVRAAKARGREKAMKYASRIGLFCIFILGTAAAPGALRAMTNEELEKEVQTLKGKVQELERYTFPPEKSDEIKKVSEYVCPDGHTFPSAPERMVCPYDGLPVKERSALIKVKLDRREEIGEKMSGMMEEEFKKRVSVAVSGTGIVQHVASSLEPSTKKQTFAQGSADVYLVSRPMKNALFFIDLESQGGQGPDSSIANNSVLDNDITTLPAAVQQDETRLREAWVQKTWAAQQFQFVAGKIDLTNYFDRNRAANDETSQFVTGTLVNSPVVGNPPNGPGAMASYDSRRGVAASLGVQSPNGSGVNVTEQPYSIAEIDARVRFLWGQLGNYRFWGARNGRTTGPNVDDYSLGISMDQEVGPHLIAFGRIGRGFKRDNVRDPHAWSAGFMLHDFIPERRRDRAGIGYSHYLTAEGPGLSGETESAGEAYYSVYLTDHLFVSPIGQYVFHSAGNASGSPQSNILILGLRTQVYF